MIYPETTATKKQIRIIIQIFFALFLFLNKTIIPNPEFTNKPANKAPKDKLPSINSSLNNKEEAQLGINPIIEENNECYTSNQ